MDRGKGGAVRCRNGRQAVVSSGRVLAPLLRAVEVGPEPGRKEQAVMVGLRVKAMPWVACRDAVAFAAAVARYVPGLHVRQGVLDTGADTLVDGVEVLFPLR